MREVNLRIYELTRDLDGEGDYFCECGSSRCRERTIIPMHAHAFADLLALDNCFVVAHGHAPAGARVLHEHPNYVLVEVPGL